MRKTCQYLELNPVREPILFKSSLLKFKIENWRYDNILSMPHSGDGDLPSLCRESTKAYACITCKVYHFKVSFLTL